MARIISASIDLSKIDKNKIQKFDKDGNPFKNGAQYYNIDIVVNDEANSFGQDVSISNAQSKEERQAKEKKTFIGNGKTVWKKESGATESTTIGNETPSTTSAADDDLPF